MEMYICVVSLPEWWALGGVGMELCAEMDCRVRPAQELRARRWSGSGPSRAGSPSRGMVPMAVNLPAAWFPYGGGGGVRLRAPARSRQPGRGRLQLAAGEERMRAAGGERMRCGALFFCVVAVGDRRVWVRDSIVLCDPNDDMGLLFAFQVRHQGYR